MSRRPISLQVDSGSTPTRTRWREAGAWMMHPERLISWLTVIALSTALVAASKQTPEKASSEEPFRSFRVLDAKLTLLTNQQNALKAALNHMGSDEGLQKYELHGRWNRTHSGWVGAFVQKSPSELRGSDVQNYAHQSTGSSAGRQCVG
jgi:hypothetical protein